jgi:hypothetical protein
MNEQEEKLQAARCWLFHKWTRWELYKQPLLRTYQGKQVEGSQTAFENRQRRQCVRCGRTKDEFIS